jgi:hypothetical protein
MLSAGGAPTANAGSDQTVPEGATVQLDGTGSSDPDGDPLTYTWTLVSSSGPTIALTPPAAAPTFVALDDGIYTFRLTVTDGKHGADDDEVTVTVSNVNPVVNAGFPTTPLSCTANTASLAIDVTDAGANDTHQASITWGDGSATQLVEPVTSGQVVTHAYGNAGSYNATVTVTDDDGGTGVDNANAIAVHYTIAGGGVLQPINQDGTSIFKAKSTIPIKIKVQDCDGSYPVDLAPTLGIVKISGSTPPGVVENVTSTSAADSGNVMRFDAAASQYVYNLAAKSLSDPSASYRLTITIPATGQTIVVDFGLKP